MGEIDASQNQPTNETVGSIDKVAQLDPEAWDLGSEIKTVVSFNGSNQILSIPLKQKRFLDALIKTRSIRLSAFAVGVNKETGRKWLRSRRVREYVKELFRREAVINGKGITYLKSKLYDVFDGKIKKTRDQLDAARILLSMEGAKDDKSREGGGNSFSIEQKQSIPELPSPPGPTTGL